MKPPKITPGWVAGGWELEQGHVPGSRRMLGIWALSGLTAVAVTQLGAQLGELHAGMYAGAGVGSLGILAGAAVYRRCEKAFTLPDTGPWSDGLPIPGRLADHLTTAADDQTPRDDIDQDDADRPDLVPVRVRRADRLTPAPAVVPETGPGVRRWSA